VTIAGQAEIVARVCDLRVHGGLTVTAGDAVQSAGELAVFCRPVVTAPAAPLRLILVTLPNEKPQVNQDQHVTGRETLQRV
jgi:hypothetical protein